MAGPRKRTRIDRRRLQGLEIPNVDNQELRRYLESTREHIETFEGRGPLKERFVTVDDLERAGIVQSRIRSNFAEISGAGSAITGGSVGSGGPNTFSGLADTDVANVQPQWFTKFNGGRWIAFDFDTTERTIDAKWTFEDETCFNDDLFLANAVGVNWDNVAGDSVEHLRFASVTTSPIADASNIGIDCDFNGGDAANAGVGGDGVIEAGTSVVTAGSPFGGNFLATDGTINDALEFADPDSTGVFSQRITDNFTIQFRVRVNGFEFGSLWESNRLDGGTVGFNIFWNGNNVRVRNGVSTTIIDTDNSIGDLSSDVWYHIAVEHVSGGTLRLYVDGVLADTQTATAYASADSLNDITNIAFCRLTLDADIDNILYVKEALYNGANFTPPDTTDLSSTAETFLVGDPVYPTQIDGILTTVTGDAQIDGTANVTGATTLESTLGVTGAAAFSDTLDADGLATFNNGVEITNSGLIVSGSGLTVTTPGGASVPSQIDVPAVSLPAFAQQFAIGIDSGSNSSARVFSVFDQRAGPHQPSIAVFDPTENDLIGFSWDGSSVTGLVKTVGANIGLNINGATKFIVTPTTAGFAVDTFIESGNELRVYDGTDTGYVAFSHDGDLNVVGNTTTDINISGITAIAAGTVDADFDAITATSYGGILEANLLSRIIDEVVAGNYTFSNNLTVDGNLTVGGTTTTINSNVVSIADNIITLNSDEVGVPSQNAGIEIERGTSANVLFQWDETNDTWRVDDPFRVYANGTPTDYIELSADGTDAALNAVSVARQRFRFDGSTVFDYTASLISFSQTGQFADSLYAYGGAFRVGDSGGTDYQQSTVSGTELLTTHANLDTWTVTGARLDYREDYAIGKAGGFQTHTREYSIVALSSTPLLDRDGNNYGATGDNELICYVYTGSTGTENAAVGVFQADDGGAWSLIDIYEFATGSNNPNLIIDGSGFPALENPHPTTTYPFFVKIEETNNGTRFGDWLSQMTSGTGGGLLPTGSTANAILKWNGSDWVEDTAIRAVGNDHLDIRSTAPTIWFYETDAAADNQNWYLGVLSEAFTGRIYNDAFGTSIAWLNVQRTGSTTVDSIQLNATTLDMNGNMDVSGALTATGTVTGSNLNIANWDTAFSWGDHAGQYLDYSANFGAFDVDAANGSGVFLGSTGSWTNRGPAANNAGGLLSFNTHPGNYYTQFWFNSGNAAGVYFRNASNVLPTGVWRQFGSFPESEYPFQDITAEFGTIQVEGAYGSAGTWSGYSIGGEAVFMSNLTGVATTNRFGLYDDLSNNWVVQYNNSATSRELHLYYDGGQRMRTWSSGIAIAGSSTDALLEFYQSDFTARVAYIQGRASDGDFVIRGEVHGGRIRLQNEDAGGATRDMIIADPDGSVILYNDGVQKVQTTTVGLEFAGSTANALGGLVTTYNIFSNSDNSDRGYFGFIGAVDMEWRSVNHGGRMLMRGEDTGGTLRSMLLADPDGGVDLHWAGTRRFYLQNPVATGATSAARVTDSTSIDRDVGFNTLSDFNVNASDTLESGHCGAMAFTDNSTTYTLTLEGFSSSDFPVDGVTTIVNAGTGNYTITEGASTTLYYVDPGTGRTDTAGGCTIGPGGVATIWRQSFGVYYIWGSEITP